jgi:hypothetical protein
MKRNELINRLVDRKLQSSDKRNALCVCMARLLCWGNARPGSGTNVKK